MPEPLTDAYWNARPASAARGGASSPTAPLERVKAAFATAEERHVRDASARAEAAVRGIPGDLAVEATTALALAADVLVSLGADGALATDDVRSAVDAVEDVLETTTTGAEYLLYRSIASVPQLLDLPPLVGIGLHLRFLVDLGVVRETSLWRRDDAGLEECVIESGPDPTSRQARREAHAVLHGRSALHVARRSSLCSVPVLRFGEVAMALVGTPKADHARASTFMAIAARAVEPLAEREFLLDRNERREHMLVAAGERRLTRLGFDLHDGPVQDVLALAAELKILKRDLDPFVAPSHRDLAQGRFDDAIERLAEIDRSLRAVAHSLDTSAILTRPLGEVVHRSVDAFALRTGIDATAEIRGDLGALSDSQRIVIFRAIQEALSNVREHSGASSVRIVLRASRSGTHVEITDDGRGFEISPVLARAAQQGRLGVLGINERARLLGGTFELESGPGGPTTVRLSLPRWERLDSTSPRPS